MADESTYHNGYHHVRDDDDHDGVLLGQHLGTVGSAGRDVADAGRDLTAAGDDANRDLIHAVANGTQHGDLMSAVREEGGDARATTLDARGHVTDQVNLVGRDILREGAATREEVGQQGKENAIHVLNEGSKGRETTAAVGAQIREDIADAHKESMLAHCETQKLVITQHCETREAVREEGVRVREQIANEARAALERELSKAGDENTLLKLRLDILSGGGTGPLRG